MLEVKISSANRCEGEWCLSSPSILHTSLATEAAVAVYLDGAGKVVTVLGRGGGASVV